MTIGLLIALLIAAEEPKAETHWYGWQTAAVDGVAAAMGAAAFALGRQPAVGANTATSLVMGYTSIGLYALGGPAVHLAHRKAPTAFGDLAMRAGLPLVGGIAGVVLFAPFIKGECSAPPACPILARVGAGMVLGGVAASALDAWLLAEEGRPGPNARERILLVPAVAWHRGRGATEHPAFGLLAAF